MTWSSTIVPAATINFCKDIAPFTQALMLKTSPDRFDHGSGSACRLPWSPHDALCPGPQPEKTTREPSCWLRREEKEQLLMREINHRAKNMLSVVDAIAHQTATK